VTSAHLLHAWSNVVLILHLIAIVVLFFEKLHNLVLQGADLELVNEYLLVVLLQLFNEFSNSCLILQVLLLLLEEVGLALRLRLVSGVWLLLVFERHSLFAWADIMRLQHHGRFIFGIDEILGQLLSLLVNLNNEVLFEVLLLLDIALEHLLLKLDSVELYHKVGVLFGLLLDFILVTVLLLDGIGLQSSNVSLLVSQVLIKLVDLFQVLLLTRLGVSSI